MLCTECEHPMRPPRARLSDHPGTRTHIAGGRCRACWDRMFTTVRADRLEDHERLRPHVEAFVEHYQPPGLDDDDPKVKEDAQNVIHYFARRRAEGRRL